MTSLRNRLESAEQQVTLARGRLEEANQRYLRAIHFGTRQHIEAAGNALTIALDQCIEIEDKIEAMTEDQIDEGIDAEADRCSSHVDCSEGGAA